MNISKICFQWQTLEEGNSSEGGEEGETKRKFSHVNKGSLHTGITQTVSR